MRFPLDALPETQRPALTPTERRRLASKHTRADVRWIDDEAVYLARPECAACGEPWEQWGCSTTRALILLAITETELTAERRRVGELTDALTPRFGVHRLSDPRNQTIELRMRIDRYSLVYGGMGVVYATLEKMGAEFRKWFKDVGDRARIAEDHRHALALDNERYVFLTQEFDPSVPFIKAPGAPWEDA